MHGVRSYEVKSLKNYCGVWMIFAKQASHNSYHGLIRVGAERIYPMQRYDARFTKLNQGVHHRSSLLGIGRSGYSLHRSAASPASDQTFYVLQISRRYLGSSFSYQSSLIYPSLSTSQNPPVIISNPLHSHTRSSTYNGRRSQRRM